MNQNQENLPQVLDTNTLNPDTNQLILKTPTKAFKSLPKLTPPGIFDNNNNNCPNSSQKLPRALPKISLRYIQESPDIDSPTAKILTHKFIDDTIQPNEIRKNRLLFTDDNYNNNPLNNESLNHKKTTNNRHIDFIFHSEKKASDFQYKTPKAQNNQTKTPKAGNTQLGFTRELEDMRNQINLGESLKKSKKLDDYDKTDLEDIYYAKCKDLNVAPNDILKDQFKRSIIQNSTMNKFVINDGYCGENAIMKICKILKNHKYDINELILKKNTINQNKGLESLIKTINLLPNLYHLDLSNNDMSTDDLCYLFTELTKYDTLTSIDISNYDKDKPNKLGLKAALSLKDFLNKEDQSLKSLKIGHLCIEDQSMIEIMDGLINIKSLTIFICNGNNITSKSMNKIGHILKNPNLKELNLSYNKLGDDFIRLLASILQENAWPKENELALDLSNNLMQERTDQLFYYLSWNRIIKRLNVSNNELGRSSSVKLKTFLYDNTHIIELNIANCYLRDIGGKYMAWGLAKNKNLVILNINSNDFGDNASALIIRALYNHKNLKELYISNNFLEIESGNALIDLIRNNMKIIKYDISFNFFNNVIGDKILSALYKNKNIISFNTDCCQIKCFLTEKMQQIVKANQRLNNNGLIPKLREEINKGLEQIKQDKLYINNTGDLSTKKKEMIDDIVNLQEELKQLKNHYRHEDDLQNQVLKELKKDIKNADKLLNQVDHNLAASDYEFQQENIKKWNKYTELKNEYMSLEPKLEQYKTELNQLKNTFNIEILELRKEYEKLGQENNELEKKNQESISMINEEKKRQFVEVKSTPKLKQIFLATSQLATIYKSHKNEGHDLFNINKQIKAQYDFVKKNNEKLTLQKYDKMLKKKTKNRTKNIASKSTSNKNDIIMNNNSNNNNNNNKQIKDDIIIDKPNQSADNILYTDQLIHIHSRFCAQKNGNQ